jgi:hypothetical protein
MLKLNGFGFQEISNIYPNITMNNGLYVVNITGFKTLCTLDSLFPTKSCQEANLTMDQIYFPFDSFGYAPSVLGSFYLKLIFRLDTTNSLFTF